MIKKFPLLQAPTLQDADEMKELEPALETERLVYDYKMKSEEMYSIFDEIKEYLYYDDFGQLQDLHSGIALILEADKGSYASLIAHDGQRTHILEKDFLALLSSDHDKFLDVLYEAIELKERRKISHEGGYNDAEAKAHREEEIGALAIGKLVRLTYLLDFRFIPLQAAIQAFSSEELKKINVFKETFSGKVRNAINDIRVMKKGIAVVKASGAVDAVRKPEETGTVYNVENTQVQETNEGLRQAFLRKKLRRMVVDLNKQRLANKENLVTEEEKNDMWKIMNQRSLEGAGGGFQLGIETKFDKVGNIVDRDFFTAYVNYHHELKGLYQLLQKGKIVETAAVMDIIERAMPMLKKNPPTIVYFHGHTGTGKTALAVHISRTRFGKEPIIVSGNKYLDPDKFTEEFRIKKEEEVEFLNSISTKIGKEGRFNEKTSFVEIVSELVGNKSELREAISKKMQGESEEKLTEKELKDVDTQLDNLFTNSVQGRYVLGAMFRAMSEGRPLIIDEANAISPEVLIAFNDLLTRKIGEKISVRADVGEFEIKEGYCVMWTGNIGERYKKGRDNDTDAATFSRIVPIQVNYLPQAREVNSMEALMKRFGLEKLNETVLGKSEAEIKALVGESKEQAGIDQIFQVLLVKLLNKRLGTQLLVRSDDRYSVFKDLYRLALGSRMIMDLFEGETTHMPSYPNLEKLLKVSDAVTIAGKLKKANLTLRELMDNIIGGYLDEGMSMDIEFYLFKFVQKQEVHPEEQLILYAILQKAGFFGVAQGWPNYEKCERVADFTLEMKFDPFAITKYKKIRQNGNSITLLNTKGEYQLEYFTSIEVMQLMYGFLPPRSKQEYQDLLKVQKQAFEYLNQQEKMKELLRKMGKMQALLTTDLLRSNLKKSSEQVAFKQEIQKFKLSDKEFVTSAGEEVLMESMDRFCNLMLNFAKDAGKISETEVQDALRGNVAGKANAVLSAFNQ